MSVFVTELELRFIDTVSLTALSVASVDGMCCFTVMRKCYVPWIMSTRCYCACKQSDLYWQQLCIVVLGSQYVLGLFESSTGNNAPSIISI